MAGSYEGGPVAALRRIAFLMERGRGETRRIQAFRNAAAVILPLPADEVAARAESGTLTDLAGIGPSTAAAIASQAWNDRHAILDGNVKRVLARYHGVECWPGLPAVERRLWAHAREHVLEASLPSDRLADYTQAQMDLGATICTRSRPACTICPLPM